MATPDFSNLKSRATRLRCDVVEMIARAGSGHNGGSLSAADVIAYLYFHQMRIDPQRPDWPHWDRFASSGRDYRKLLAAYEIDAAAIVRQALFHSRTIPRTDQEKSS